jgi:hypothetical protein
MIARRFDVEYPQKSPQSGVFEVDEGAEKRCKSLNLLGGRGRNRTYNLSVKSRMLCQLSYASNWLEHCAARKKGTIFAGAETCATR